MKKTTFTLLILLSFSPFIFGQTREIIFEEIQAKDGVLHRIFNLYQDSHGFIWFRTAGDPGIQRYDGYSFVHFLDSSGFFTSIMEDSRGLFWLGTASGITLFDPENETILHYYPDPESFQNNYSLNNIIKIMEDEAGIIWCATTDGLLRIAPRENAGSLSKDDIFSNGIAVTCNISTLRISMDSAAGSNQINEIVEDSKGRLWIGGPGILFVLNRTNLQLTRMDDDGRGKSRLDDPFISSIIEENPDVLWAGTGNGLYRISNLEKAFGENAINKNSLVFRQYLEKKLIMGLLRDNQHALWIGTYLNGLVQMKYDQNHQPAFKEVYTALQEPEGEGIRTIFSLMKDRTGLIWAGHQYGGIRKFNPEGNYFVSYENLVRRFFDHYELTAIYKDARDNLWIGTLGDGLHKIDREGKVTHYYIWDSHVPDKSGNGVISLLEIESGIFWIGAANGIWQFNATTGRSRKLFTQTPFGELNNYVHNMLKMDDWILFTLWGEGLFIYHPATAELKLYQYDPKEASGLKSNINYTLCTVKKGEIFIGGSRGLCRAAFNRLTGELTFLPLPFSPAAMAQLGTVNELLETRDHMVWCCTNNGLLRLDLQSGTVRRWTAKDGLSFDVIRAMETDDGGNLWLGTSNGLSMINPETGKIKVFTKEHGLPVAIHGHHASFKDRAGFLFFGGIGGFYSFLPESIQPNATVPPVVLTDFRLFNKPVNVATHKKAVLTSGISHARKINLTYNQHDIAFEFAALDYTRPSENRYAYRLEGYQQDWLETHADNRIASYTNLNPGTYVFRVKASNNDGVWNESGAAIAIVISPPWWKTTWAYAVYVLLFLLLLRGYIVWRTWKLRKEKAILEKQVAERTQQIAAQKEELYHQKEQLEATLENLQRTQEQLIESKKMAALGGLVAGVAHEINTPVGIGVTAISALMEDVRRMAERFQKDEISRADFREFLQSAHEAGILIHRNLERTALLVQSFKQVSVDQVSEQKRTFNLKSYLADIVSSLQPKFKDRMIELKLDCDERLELASYPGVFAQLFTNLILNSLQHGFAEKHPGIITIKAALNHELLQILYADDGTGISPKDLPHIFEPFYTSDQKKGIGLGLNIVYNLVTQKLKGTVLCESKVGEGTLFRIEIPCKDEAGA